MSSFEYQLTSEDIYNNCVNTAYDIIESTALKYHIKKSQVRYGKVINYLASFVGPTDICLFVSKPYFAFSYHQSKEIIKQYFNHRLQTCGLNLSAEIVNEVSIKFINGVSGFTLFYPDGSIMFLNASPQPWGRTVFTIIHELVHAYKAWLDPNYKKQVALINRDKSENNPYPEELRPIETKANTIASLVYAPDDSLKTEVMYNSFEQMRNIYGMSKSAFHNRLRNFLHFTCGFTVPAATKYTLAFRNEELDNMKKCRNAIYHSLYDPDFTDDFIY